jgi:hypothetical protein
MTTPPSTIETRFPRIASAIQLLWGHPEMDTYFQKLVVDERGDREGFPPDVMSDLLFLATLHKTSFKFEPPQPKYAASRYDHALAFK